MVLSYRFYSFVIALLSTVFWQSQSQASVAWQEIFTDLIVSEATFFRRFKLYGSSISAICSLS